MKIKQHTAFLILLLLSHTVCFCQEEKINSLKKAAMLAKGSERVERFVSLSQEYIYIDTDSSIAYGTKAYNEAAKINYPDGMSLSLYFTGIAEFNSGNYLEAERCLRLSIPFQEQHHNAGWLAGLHSYLGQTLAAQGKFNEAIAEIEKSVKNSETYDDILGISLQTGIMSNIYRSLGDYKQAFYYSQETIRLTQKLKDTVRLMICSNLITGDLYKDAGDYAMALEYFKKTDQYANRLGIPHVAYKFLGQTYSLMKNYDTSLYYYSQVLKAAASIASKRLRTNDLINDSLDIYEVYLSQQRYDGLAPFFSRALEYFLKRNAQPQVIRILFDLTRINEEKKDPIRALYYAYKGLTIAQETEARPLIRDGYRLLAEIYDMKNNNDSAYLYYKRYIAMEKSLVDDQYKRTLTLKNLHDSEEKNQAKISLLNQEKRKQLYLFLGIGFIGLLLTVFFIRSMTLQRRKEQLQHRMAETKILLEQQKKEQQFSALQQRATELEMQVLRSQMNPHFIFNSLNAINRFILQNNKPLASEYLTKFSKLIRLILQNSQADLISLESELETLELYLDLEAVRFDNRFCYRIIIPNEMDISVLKVPPLIIQPYAENAIWHGLMHKEEKGQLDIEISGSEKYLFFKISDDGIGRKQSAAIASKSITRHKSMGLRITADRISMIQDKESGESAVTINDLVDNSGKDAGTEVIIKLPIIYD